MSHSHPKQKISYPFLSVIRDAFSFVTKKDRVVYWIALFFSVTQNLVWLYQPIGLAQAIDFAAAYTQGESLMPLYWILFWLLVIALWRAVGKHAARMLGYPVAEKSALDAYALGVKRLFRLGAGWHENENSGNKIKRILKGSRSVNQILRIILVPLTDVVITIPGIIIILLALDQKYALGIIVFMLVIFVSARYFFGRGAERSNEVNKAEEVVSGLAFESISNLKTVRVMSLGDTLYKRIKRSLHTVNDRIVERISMFQTGGMINNALGNLARLTLVGFGLMAVVNGQFEVGFVVLLYGYFNSAWSVIIRLTDIFREFAVARYGQWRLMEVIKEPDYYVTKNKGKKFPEKWSTYTINDLSFGYEDENEEILKDITLTIKRGEKIGIVGPSGAGKSTLFKVLLREYHVDDGVLMVDDQDVNHLSYSEYYQRVGVVLQDTEVFNFSLRENITMANQGKYDKKNFAQSLKIAHVNDFLDKLPEGDATVIGEKGFKLSGGERQRLGLARAIYKQPEIFLLDEATSHLDAESEQAIQDSLHKFFKGVTAIVIAHRLSTIKEMDRIIVLEKGRIVEEGSYRSLIRKKGRFHELWEKQKL